MSTTSATSATSANAPARARPAIAPRARRGGHVYAPMALSRRPPRDDRARAAVAVRGAGATAGATAPVTRHVSVGAMPSLAGAAIGAAVGGVAAFVLFSSGVGDAGSLPTFAAAGGVVAGAVGGAWIAAHATETQKGYEAT